jgi:hypothetical protein
MKCRWRNDGGDWLTGSQGLGMRPGGMVAWRADGTWRAYAWSGVQGIEFRRIYKDARPAQRAVEKWLARPKRAP